MTWDCPFRVVPQFAGREGKGCPTPWGGGGHEAGQEWRLPEWAGQAPGRRAWGIRQAPAAKAYIAWASRIAATVLAVLSTALAIMRKLVSEAA